MYAITDYILRRMAARGWRKSELVLAMGYRDLSRGLNRLERCLREGDCSNTVLLARMRQALGSDNGRFEVAVNETQRQRQQEERARLAREEEERRARFRPYVHVRTTETRPGLITIAAVIGPRLKSFQLAGTLLSLPRPLLLARVSEIVRDHYRDNLGRCPLFGQITGYAFRIAYDATVVFDTEGNLVQETSGWHEHEGDATLTVNHHVIRSGLFESS